MAGGSRPAWAPEESIKPCKPSRRPLPSQPGRPTPEHRRHPALTMSARRKTEAPPEHGESASARLRTRARPPSLAGSAQPEGPRGHRLAGRTPA